MVWGVVVGGCSEGAEFELHRFALPSFLPNNHPVKNAHGFSATFSTQGRSTSPALLHAPGDNGRHCGSCHKPEDGWSISAATLQRIFDETGGLDPVFNLLDADRPTPSPSNDALRAASVAERRAVSPCCCRGSSPAGSALPANAEFEVIDVDDPFGVSPPALLVLPAGHALGQLPILPGQLGQQQRIGDRSARRAGQPGPREHPRAQQGVPDETIVQEIVNYEKALFHAQLILGDICGLDEGGAKGGPQNLSKQAFVAGPSPSSTPGPGTTTPSRRRSPAARRCSTTRNRAAPAAAAATAPPTTARAPRAASSTSGPRAATSPGPTWPFTLRNKATGEIRCTTDGGRAFRSGRWSDVDRFDTRHCAVWAPAAATSTTASPPP